MPRCQICVIYLGATRTRTEDEPPISDLDSAEIFEYESSKSNCSILFDQSGCRNVREELPFNHSRYRHISGPGCTCDTSYNGRNIRQDEMQGGPSYIIRRRVQGSEHLGDGLKSNWYFPEDAIRLQNGHGRFYVNGNINHVFAPRNSDPAQYPHSPMNVEPLGIVVHSSCWDIFARIYADIYGEVDIQAFVALFFRESCKNCGFQEMPHHPAVARNCIGHRTWDHTPGTEFLVANPQNVPGFLATLQLKYSKPLTTKPRRKLEQMNINNHDPFFTMPFEIRSQIAEQLSYNDFLNLRTVSRIFWMPDPRLHLNFIKRDFPWFWEFDELKHLDELYHLKLTEIREAERMADASTYRARQTYAQLSRLYLSVARTPNWEILYQQLYFAKREIKGVKNRARIWEVAEEIVKRIQRLREVLPEEFDEESGSMLLPEAGFTKEEIESGVAGRKRFDCLRCRIYSREYGGVSGRDIRV